MDALVWDNRLLDMCELAASWSKDPSTKFGAVLVGKYDNIRAVCYNGFPRRVEYNDASRLVRPKKYSFMVHAEANVVVQVGRDVAVGGKVYLSSIPHSDFTSPCTVCAGLIIQAGIIEIVYRRGNVREEEPENTWRDSLVYAKEMLDEAGVIMREVK